MPGRQLGGGKFANGAAMGAFAALFSDETYSKSIDDDSTTLDRDAEWAARKSYSEDGLGLEEIGVSYLKDNPSGLEANLFSINGKNYLAFSGTEDLRDWATNLRQGLGISDPQYSQAIKLAVEVHARLGGDVIFTGHSLGGGLAAAAAGATRGYAVTFNASGVAALYRGNPGSITSHVIKGELLAVVQNLSPAPRARGTTYKYEGFGSALQKHLQYP